MKPAGHKERDDDHRKHQSKHNGSDQHDLITDIFNALDRTPLTSAVICLKTAGIPDELGAVDGKMIALSSSSEHHWAVDAH